MKKDTLGTIIKVVLAIAAICAAAYAIYKFVIPKLTEKKESIDDVFGDDFDATDDDELFDDI